MKTPEQIKKIVEHLCCDYTHGTLMDLCRFYYEGKKKDLARARRTDLEDIAFIILALGLRSTGKYNVIAEDTVVKESLSAVQVIDFIRRKTIFRWCEEPVYPELIMPSGLPRKKLTIIDIGDKEEP